MGQDSGNGCGVHTPALHFLLWICGKSLQFSELQCPPLQRGQQTQPSRLLRIRHNILKVCRTDSFLSLAYEKIAGREGFPVRKNEIFFKFCINSWKAVIQEFVNQRIKQSKQECLSHKHLKYCIIIFNFSETSFRGHFGYFLHNLQQNLLHDHYGTHIQLKTSPRPREKKFYFGWTSHVK